MLSTGARLPAQWPLRSFRNVSNYGLTRWRLPLASSCRSLTTPSESVVPLRKQLKDEAKKRRSLGKPTSTLPSGLSNDAWELTVGIEIHAELNTARKLFSDAPTSVNDQPNTNIALFDLAYPGSQPHFQHATILPALRAAIALNCNIQRKSCFDRKHYFYQDQPAGYQITQYYEPFARDGYITLSHHDGIAAEDGEQVTIGIKQIQMEQDTAKTIQQPPSSHYLDFNRVSHPLIEIITLPQIHHPSTAAALVRKIQSILKAANACTAGMEIGGLRADVNVSVRRQHSNRIEEGQNSYHGVTGLGQRTEIKNLSSFKAVEDAIIAERDRQICVLEAGGVVEGETRGWTLGSTETKKLRGKEGEVDYRYMPDPDISPVIVSNELIEHLRATLPMMPDELLDMLTKNPKYELTAKDAKTLISFEDGDRLEYYFDVVDMIQAHAGSGSLQSIGRSVGNWVIHELGGLFSKADVPWSSHRIPSDALASVISMVQKGSITIDSAKKLVSLLFEGDTRDVQTIAEQEKLLIQEIADNEYSHIAERLINENPEIVKAVKEKGQHGKIMWFVGQAMKSMSKSHGGGGVRPEKTKDAVLKALDLSLDTLKTQKK